MTKLVLQSEDGAQAVFGPSQTLKVKAAAFDVDWQALGFAFVVGSWIAA